MAKGRVKKVIDITPEEKPQISTELVKHIEEKNLPVAISEKIVEILSPVFLQLKDWDEKVESIEIVDENDKHGMLTAAESRKFVKATRIDIKKQVDEQVSILKEEMQPYLDNIEGWKTVFQFAEAVMKSIESKALDKEKYAEKLKQKRIDDLRTARAEIAEPLKIYIGYALDFGMISEEEFDKLIHNAKLAQKADLEEKEAAKKEAERKEKELELEKRYTNRLNMIYSLGMQKGDGVFFYKDYQVLDDSIKNSDDFDTLFEGIEAKVNTIKEADRKIKEEEERKAKEIADAETARLQKVADDAKAAAEAKRAFINGRIAQISGAVIQQDALYVKYANGTTNKLISYEEIYTMPEEGWHSFFNNHNNSFEEYNETYRKWQEEQESIRIAEQVRIATEQKERDDAALLARQQELANKVKSEMSDKEKIDSLLTEIRNFSKRIDNEFIFQSDLGNSMKNNVISLFEKIIVFIKQKQ
jgi:hypothetical protein